MKERIVLHCDCNGFFASVESVLRPELKKVPMAVCGSPDNRHGIILAKNELAKKFDIQTAETAYSAKRKCPELVLVSPHREEYSKYSKLLNQIYLTKTDLVEPFGIDESWLDVTNTAHLFGSGVEIADALRKEVRESLGITISVGVSFNKVFAKIGSDYKKPDATTEFSKEDFKQTVWRLPVESLLYVGDASKKVFESMYVKTIGDLANIDPRQLTLRLGKMGIQLWNYANGLDDSPVRSYYDKGDAKSISNGMTFNRNLVGEEEIQTGIGFLCDEVAYSLRQQNLLAGTLAVSIKDTSLKVITRQRQFDSPTQLSCELFATSVELIKENWDMTAPVRMVTITVTGLTDKQEGEQMSLFSQNVKGRAKQLKLETALDNVRDKFGRDSVSKASRISGDIGVYYPSKKGQKEIDKKGK